MALTTLPWDAADHLDDDDAIEAYLDAALEDGDPKLVVAALSDIARAKGMTDLAARTGLPPDALRQTLSGEGNPDFGSIMKILAALGFQFAARQKPSVDAA